MKVLTEWKATIHRNSEYKHECGSNQVVYRIIKENKKEFVEYFCKHCKENWKHECPK